MSNLALRCFAILFLIFFVFLGDVQAFDYKEMQSGDSSETVKNYIASKGNKFIVLDENRLTTEYGSNVRATFVFNDNKLCKVYTNYGEKQFRWIISDIDYKIRQHGSPFKIVSSGEAWGDGFTIHWQNQKQTLIYDVGKLDLFGQKCALVKSTQIDGNICN